MDDRRLPLYAYFGLAMLAASEVAMFAHVEPFWSWHTPIAWSGYILLVDGIVYRKRSSSWLTGSRREFWFLTFASIPLWLVFKAYNLLIENWHYVNLPDNPIARYFGYAWSFATISPAIFETAELAAALVDCRPSTIAYRRSTMAPRRRGSRYARVADRVAIAVSGRSRLSRVHLAAGSGERLAWC
ncbi:MAG: hypothetical protein EXQ55_02000 [Acidobacteria bacterium]|nr:hypothetical protein [Acidobacteriota bacterium]